MIRPASFIKTTPLYILIFFLLLLASLLQKTLGKNYTDILIFFAFPGLISGTLFQIYPTLQGHPFRGEPLIYVHLVVWFINLLFYFLKGSVNPYAYLLLSSIHTVLVLLNTRKIKDSVVLFFLTGSLFYLLAGVLIKENPIFVKHLITVGYFMPVIVGSYYVFVPMLQIEELTKRGLIWLNLLLQIASSVLVPLFWYISDYTLLSYSGTLLLLSVGTLSYSVYHMLSQRKSPLKGLDVSVQFFILGLFMCWFFLLVGVLTAGSGNFGFFQLHSDGMLYGFLTTISVGASYHIIPFLLWWRRYAPRMGKEKVPILKEVLNISVVKKLLILLPPLTTGLSFGDMVNPYVEKAFSLALFLLLGYYTVKIFPLVLKTLKS
ncbi:hypothetical protein HRbin13_01306 [bacterium HR13]|nr:hypothetical protein HRbin13_01306 [bacterium HR13]